MSRHRHGAASLALAICAAILVPAVNAPRTAAQSAPPGTMAAVPAGDYWMGRTRLWLIDEINWQIRERMDDRPVHRVSIDGFSIDVREVTNADYAAFVEATGAATPYQWGGSTPPPARLTLPVYNVSWHEATAYCAWLGKRLPTEAEWEKAARGGEADLDFPWGNEYDTEGAPPPAADAGSGEKPAPRAPRVKHAHSASASGPRPVASYEPNGLGLYDMSGNVWEWVSDWYDLYYYGVSPIENPKGPADGLYKVIRGGSWADTDPRLGAVYFRNFASPDEQSPTIGFRCAR
jgi:formylglycine-generating enzyme required for sulfatase activity